MRILKNEKFSIGLIIAGVVLTILGLVLFIWSENNFSIHNEIKSDKFGQLGDFVGGIVGSIWSLAGIILFYIALNEQRKDFKTNQEVLNLQVEALNQQVNEFEFQRKELESSRKVYEEQSRTQRQQQFESNFYSLLNVYLTIKNNLNVLDQERDFFKTLYQHLHKAYNADYNVVENHDLMVQTYTNLYNDNRGHLSHYFKSFYRIVKIIDSNMNLNESERVFYAKILRSQLTDYENLLLYYNSHSVYGIKSRSLILKYNLLKHIPIFKKPEFGYFHLIQKDATLLFFCDFLNQFICNHLSEYYDLNSEVTNIEENCEYFACIVGIYFTDNIEIKVHCRKNIRENNIKLSESEFSTFLYYFLYERLIYNNYIERDPPELIQYLTDMPENKIFGIKITSKINLNLNTDKF